MVKNEIRSLAGIRGVAAFYVMVFHFYYYYRINASKTSIFCNHYWYAFISHGYLAVDVFFLLSAFLITLSSEKFFDRKFEFSNYKLFMQKRWIRVYPAYFFIILFGYIFILHFQRTANFILSLTLLNLLFWLPTLFGHLWSLSAEWVTYLLYPLFYKISKYVNTYTNEYILVLIGFIVIYTGSAVVSKNFFPSNMLNEVGGYFCLIRCFGDYLIGMGAFFIFKNGKMSFLYSNVTSIILLILLMLSLFVYDADLVIVFLSAMLIISITNSENLPSKILASRIIYFLGLISYPLYLIHYLVFDKLDGIAMFLKLHFHTVKPNLTIFVTYVMINIVLATLFTYWVELPTIKFLNKIIKPKLNYKKVD